MKRIVARANPAFKRTQLLPLLPGFPGDIRAAAPVSVTPLTPPAMLDARCAGLGLGPEFGGRNVRSAAGLAG